MHMLKLLVLASLLSLAACRSGNGSGAAAPKTAGAPDMPERDFASARPTPAEKPEPAPRPEPPQREAPTNNHGW